MTTETTQAAPAGDDWDKDIVGMEKLPKDMRTVAEVARVIGAVRAMEARFKAKIQEASDKNTAMSELRNDAETRCNEAERHCSELTAKLADAMAKIHELELRAKIHDLGLDSDQEARLLEAPSA